LGKHSPVELADVRLSSVMDTVLISKRQQYFSRLDRLFNINDYYSAH